MKIHPLAHYEAEATSAVKPSFKRTITSLGSLFSARVFVMLYRANKSKSYGSFLVVSCRLAFPLSSAVSVD